MLSYKNTAEEIGKSGMDTAIIPVGSVEQHSSHLPIGTDFLYAKSLAEKAAEKFDALLLPALPISTCYEHKGKKGSVWMRPITFYQMIQDICMCLHSQGINKIVFIAGHGGIFVGPPAVREINATNDDLQVVWVNPLVAEGAKEILESNEMEIHSGESETSVMLYLYEELVKKDLMKNNDCVPPYPQSFLNCASIHTFSTTGAWGRPSLATKEKGEKLFNLAVEETVKYINDALAVATKEKW